MDLLLVRHAESEWNAAGRWQGWADPPLTEAGEDQARAAATELSGLALEAVVASDLQRARRTAEILAEQLGLGPVELDAGLRERNVGDFTGLTREEIEARWPGVLAEWRQGRVERAPNGEGREFIERILAALDRLAEQFRGRRIVVVAHGGVIRTLHRHLGGEPGPPHHLGGLWIHLDDQGSWRVGEAHRAPSPGASA
jgi:broad specificity phosphatase PhoE